MIVSNSYLLTGGLLLTVIASAGELVHVGRVREMTETFFSLWIWYVLLNVIPDSNP